MSESLGTKKIPDKTVAGILGQITWLATQSPRHKGLFIYDLEWLVMPAILMKQFKIFQQGETPVGCILWGQLSDEVVERLEQPNFRMRPNDWRSGPHLRIVDVIAPFGAEDELKAQFEAEVAANKKEDVPSGQTTH